jgi:hypothetical protein
MDISDRSPTAGRTVILNRRAVQEAHQKARRVPCARRLNAPGLPSSDPGRALWGSSRRPVRLLSVAPKPRILWPAVLVVAVVAGASWLVWVVWRSPHRSDLATFGAFAAAVVTIAAGQIAWAKNVGARRRGGESQPRALNHIADLLSGGGQGSADPRRLGSEAAAGADPCPVGQAVPAVVRAGVGRGGLTTVPAVARGTRGPAARSAEGTTAGPPRRIRRARVWPDDDRRQPRLG